MIGHGIVEAVHCSGSHTLKKPSQLTIRLLAGLGVEGALLALSESRVRLPATSYCELTVTIGVPAGDPALLSLSFRPA